MKITEVSILILTYTIYNLIIIVVMKQSQNKTSLFNNLNIYVI